MKRAVVVGVAVLFVLGGMPVASSAGGVETSAGSVAPDGEWPVLGGGELLYQDNETVQENGTEGGFNGSVRHRHPDEQGGSDEDLGGWLGDRLAERLGGGVIQISDGQYEFARDLVGEEYEQRLGQFVEVTGADDQAEQRLREAGETQRELADLREEFAETRAAYEQALEDGDDERARRLARELVALAAEIEAVSVDLEALLAEIEQTIGADLAEALDAVEAIREEVQAEREAVVEDAFVRTTLAVEADRTTVSFLDPLNATGQLRTVAGEPLGNRSIRLRVAGETVTTTTDADGRFAVAYRPTTDALNTTALGVEYVPAPDSEYFGSTDTVSVAVEQVTPTLTVEAVPDEVRFGDTVTVSGGLAADGVAVDGVSLAVFLGGQQLGTVPVTGGTFEREVTVPATVPAGDRAVTVRLPFEDRALAGVATSREVTVAETETALAASVTPAGGAPGLQVAGTLDTLEGRAVPDASVAVRVDGQRVGTLSTDGEGAFDERVAVPEDLAGEEVTVAVAYAGSANLAPSRDEATVVLPERQPQEPGGDEAAGGGESIRDTIDETGESIRDTIDETVSSTAPVVLGVVVGVGLLSVAGGVWWYRRRDRDGTAAGASGAGEQTGDQAAESAPQAAESAPRAAESTLGRAREYLQDGHPEWAVEASYAAVRDHLEASLGVTGPYTHWEFYQQCQDAVGDDATGGTEATALAVLREVTEGYERAVYSVEGIPEASAAAVLDRARELAEGETAVVDGSERQSTGSDD